MTTPTPPVDDNKDSELRPFPEIGAPPGSSAPRCATRAALDTAVCDALGYNTDNVRRIAAALAAEPCITGRQATFT